MIFSDNRGAGELSGDPYSIDYNQDGGLAELSSDYPFPEVKYGDNETLLPQSEVPTIVFNEDDPTASDDWPPGYSDEPGEYGSIIPPEDGAADGSDDVGLEAAGDDDRRRVRGEALTSAYRFLSGMDLESQEINEAEVVCDSVAMLALAAAQDHDPGLIQRLAETLDSVPAEEGWRPALAAVHYAEHLTGDATAMGRLRSLLAREAAEVAGDDEELVAKQPVLETTIRRYEEFDEDPRQLIEDHGLSESYRWVLRHEHYNRELLTARDKQDSARTEKADNGLLQNVDRFIADAEQLPSGFVLDHTLSALSDCQGDQGRTHQVLEAYFEAHRQENVNIVSPEWRWHNLETTTAVGNFLLDNPPEADDVAGLLYLNRLDELIKQQSAAVSGTGLRAPSTTEAAITWEARVAAFLNVEPRTITDAIRAEVANHLQADNVTSVEDLLRLQERVMEAAAVQFARQGTPEGDAAAKAVVAELLAKRQLEAHVECWYVAHDRDQFNRLMPTDPAVMGEDTASANLLIISSSLLHPATPEELNVEQVIAAVAPLASRYIWGPHSDDPLWANPSLQVYWRQMERLIVRLYQAAPEALPEVSRQVLPIFSRSQPPFNSSIRMDPFYGIIQKRSNNPADFELVHRTILKAEDPQAVKLDYLARLALAIGHRLRNQGQTPGSTNP